MYVTYYICESKGELIYKEWRRMLLNGRPCRFDTIKQAKQYREEYLRIAAGTYDVRIVEVTERVIE